MWPSWLRKLIVVFSLFLATKSSQSTSIPRLGTLGSRLNVISGSSISSLGLCLTRHLPLYSGGLSIFFFNTIVHHVHILWDTEIYKYAKLMVYCPHLWTNNKYFCHFAAQKLMHYAVGPSVGADFGWMRRPYQALQRSICT